MTDTGALLLDQIEFYWTVHLRPRLDGLTDAEYRWEPVPGCWTVRPGPDGRWCQDGDSEQVDPPPVTTIAWRLVHIAAGIHSRVSTFLDEALPHDAPMFDPRHQLAEVPGSAATALTLLEETYRRWYDGLIDLGPEGMAAPLGPLGGPFAADPMAALVAHVNREVMHHGGEVGVLRDLYRAGGGRPIC